MIQEIATGLLLAFAAGTAAVAGLLWWANGDIVGAAMLAARLAGCM